MIHSTPKKPLEVFGTTPPFRALDEEAIRAALADPNPENPVAVEVARLIGGYTKNFQHHVERLGHIPPTILRVKGSCPIEEVAINLTTECLRATLRNS